MKNKTLILLCILSLIGINVNANINFKGQTNFNNPRAIYNFEEVSGNYLDSSGNGYTCVITNAPNRNTYGIYGLAYNNTGGNSGCKPASGVNVIIPNNNSFSICNWGMSRGIQNFNFWGSGETGSTNNAWFLQGQVSDGSMRLLIYNISGNAVSLGGGNIPYKYWNHYCAIYNGTTFLLYINGSLYNTTIIQSTFRGFTPASRFFIGTNVDINSNSINGSIDHVEIYDYSLNDSQVNDTFYSVFTEINLTMNNNFNVTEISWYNITSDAYASGSPLINFSLTLPNGSIYTNSTCLNCSFLNSTNNQFKWIVNYQNDKYGYNLPFNLTVCSGYGIISCDTKSMTYNASLYIRPHTISIYNPNPLQQYTTGDLIPLGFNRPISNTTITNYNISIFENNAQMYRGTIAIVPNNDTYYFNSSGLMGNLYYFAIHANDSFNQDSPLYFSNPFWVYPIQSQINATININNTVNVNISVGNVNLNITNNVNMTNITVNPD